MRENFVVEICHYFVEAMVVAGFAIILIGKEREEIRRELVEA